MAVRPRSASSQHSRQHDSSAQQNSSSASRDQNTDRPLSPARKIVSKASKNINNVNDKFIKFLKRNQKLEEENKHLYAMIEKLQNEIECDKSGTIKSYTKEIELLRKSLDTQNTESARLSILLQKSNQDLSDRINENQDLVKEFNSLNSKTQSISHELSKVKNDLNKEKENSNDFYKKYQQSSEENKKLKTKIDSLSKNLADEKFKAAELATKLQSQAQAAHFSNTLHKKTQKRINDSLESMVPSQLDTSIYSEMERIMAEHELKIQNMREDFEKNAASEIEGLKKYVSEQNVQLDTFKKESKDLNSQISTLKKELEKVDDLNNKISTLNNQNLELHKDIAEKNEEIANIVKENSELEQNIASLKAMLETEDVRAKNTDIILSAKRAKFDSFSDPSSKLKMYSKAFGPLSITNVCQYGTFVELSNTCDEPILLTSLKLRQQAAGGSEIMEHIFKNDIHIDPHHALKLMTHGTNSKSFSPDDNILILSSQLIAVPACGGLETTLEEEDGSVIAKFSFEPVNQRFGIFSDVFGFVGRKIFGQKS